MKINLERNEYNTGTKLIFYEDYISQYHQAFNNITRSSSGNKQNVKRNLFSFILIVNDLHQFDRRKQRKRVLLYGTDILIRIDIHH